MVHAMIISPFYYRFHGASTYAPTAPGASFNVVVIHSCKRHRYHMQFLVQSKSDYTKIMVFVKDQFFFREELGGISVKISLESDVNQKR